MKVGGLKDIHMVCISHYLGSTSSGASGSIISEETPGVILVAIIATQLST